MTPEQLAATVKAVDAIDTASHQDINWWAALVFMLVIMAAAWILKLSLKRQELLFKDLKESQAQQVQLLAGIVTQNTAAFQELTIEVRDLRTNVAKCPGPAIRRRAK